MNPPYLRMKLYHWLVAFRLFLYRFSYKPFRMHKWRGNNVPAYPIWAHLVIDLLAYVQGFVLSKYWRDWIHIEFGDTPDDVICFLSAARCPFCKQLLIQSDELLKPDHPLFGTNHTVILCACQESIHVVD